MEIACQHEKLRTDFADKTMRISLVVLFFALFQASALDDGLARTPPMGFNCWNKFGYLVSDPDGPDNWKMMGRAMVASGMKDAGYVYVNTDGGASYSASVMKNVADSLHAIGMKMGVYMFPPYLRIDQQTYAQNLATAGADLLKYDGWSSTTNEMFTGMRDALQACGRPIVYSVNGTSGPGMSHMWRTSGDIAPTMESVVSCANTNSSGVSMPGGWGDPDILEVGNLLTDKEDLTHFSLWCVSSSPLLAGNDIRNMFHSTHYILLNTEAIAVNQDTAFSTNPSYGGSGKKIGSLNGVDLWCKTISGGAKAVVIANVGPYPHVDTISRTGTVTWSDIGLPSGPAQVRDLWEHENLGTFTDSFFAVLPAHGCRFLKIVAGTEPIPDPPVTWFPKPRGFPDNDLLPIAPLPTTGWNLTGYNVSGDFSLFIDGDPTTALRGGSSEFPESYVIIDMGKQQTFNCVVMNQTEKGPYDVQGGVGWIKRIGPALKPYRVYETNHTIEAHISDDGTTWQGPVAMSGSGPNNYTVLGCATPQTARYIKLLHKNNAYNQRRRDGGGDWDRYGFCGVPGGYGEFHVANVANLPQWAVNTHDATPVAPQSASRGSKRIAPPALKRVLSVEGRQGWNMAAGTDYYSVQGRRMASGKSFRAGIAGSGVLIQRTRISDSGRIK